jgi:hypothetical protein
LRRCEFGAPGQRAQATAHGARRSASGLIPTVLRKQFIDVRENIAQVRVRSAGAKGAGHSTWSEAVSIRIPDAQAKSQAMVLTPAGTALACEVQSGAITTSRSKKKPGVDVDAHLKTLLEKKGAPLISDHYLLSYVCLPDQIDSYYIVPATYVVVS